MEKLSKDELFLIGMQLDDKSLLNFSIAMRRFYENIYKDENFWRSKSKKYFPFIGKKEGTWKYFYCNTMRFINKLFEKLNEKKEEN